MENIATFTDSLSTLQALNSADPDQMIQGMHSSLAKLAAQFSVFLQWVPARVGLTENETIYKPAKIGVRLRRHRTLSPTEAKTLLHSRFSWEWNKENGGYQAHLDPSWRLERAQKTTIFRLRTEHCGLSAHLKRTGISDTSLCESIVQSSHVYTTPSHGLTRQLNSLP